MLKNIKFQKLLLEKSPRFRTFQDGFDEDDDYDYDYKDDDYLRKFDYDPELQDINDDDRITQEDEENNLESMIRVFLSARSIKSYVEYKNGEVIIYVFLNKKEKISNLTRIFDVILNHLSKDIFGIVDEDSLSDIETELYETKEGDHIFSFRFDLESEKYSSTEPKDYDDLPF